MSVGTPQQQRGTLQRAARTTSNCDQMRPRRAVAHTPYTPSPHIDLREYYGAPTLSRSLSERQMITSGMKPADRSCRTAPLGPIPLRPDPTKPDRTKPDPTRPDPT